MIDRTKKLPARFYVSPTGRNPVREWILELPSEDRQTVGKDIQKVEFGWPIGRPHCAPLGHGLWEVRSDLDSNRTARVMFCFVFFLPWRCFFSSSVAFSGFLLMPVPIPLQSSQHLFCFAFGAPAPVETGGK